MLHSSGKSSNLISLDFGDFFILFRFRALFLPHFLPPLPSLRYARGGEGGRYDEKAFLNSQTSSSSNATYLFPPLFLFPPDGQERRRDGGRVERVAVWRNAIGVETMEGGRGGKRLTEITHVRERRVVREGGKDSLGFVTSLHV